MGKQLLASYRKKSLIHESEEEDSELHSDQMYNPAHYDMRLVLKLIQTTLAEKRTNQSHILLEGLFNSSKLEEE
jgi:hypothetical protein